MADSTTADVTKMKVIDLRKELKSRGLASNGDKAVLIARLQSALTREDVPDEHAALGSLSSDEIDSDGVLDEDDDDKSQHDLLDDFAVESLNEELALADKPPAPPQAAGTTDVTKLLKLKRKITMSDAAKEKSADGKAEDGKEGSKKIILNRANSISALAPSDDEKEESKPNQDSVISSITAKGAMPSKVDARERLELRAKRFGLPVKMTDAERKEARKQRFEQNITGKTAVLSSTTATENIEKLKKRAERFGQSVSKFMTDVENKEKLEKRKEKFGSLK